MGYPEFVKATKLELAAGQQARELPPEQAGILQALPPQVQQAFLQVQRAINADPDALVKIEETYGSAMERFFGANMQSHHMAMLTALIAEATDPRYEPAMPKADKFDNEFGMRAPGDSLYG